PTYKPILPAQDDDVEVNTDDVYDAIKESFRKSLRSMVMPQFTFRIGTVGSGIDTAKLDALKIAEPYKVETRVPDYVSVITAWRAWRVVNQDGWRLKALGAEHVWEPKKALNAECNSGSKLYSSSGTSAS